MRTWPLSQNGMIHLLFAIYSRKRTQRSRLLRRSAHRDVRIQEMAHLVDNALPQLLGFPPREDRDFGVWRQGCDIDRGLQRMRRRVVRQDQDRRPAVLDELARHAVEKIGLGPPQAVEILLDRVNRHLGPTGA